MLLFQLCSTIRPHIKNTPFTNITGPVLFAINRIGVFKVTGTGKMAGVIRHYHIKYGRYILEASLMKNKFSITALVF